MNDPTLDTIHKCTALIQSLFDDAGTLLDFFGKPKDKHDGKIFCNLFRTSS